MSTGRHDSRLEAITLFLLAGFLVSGWSPALRDPTSGLRLTNGQAAAVRYDVPPRTIARVVDLVDMTTGQTLYSRDSTRPHAIGSITKLMTALLAVHRLNLDRVLTVSRTAASVGGSTMFLVPGDRVSVRVLLYGLLIPSGNDAAEALAEAMARSDRRFAVLMNDRARYYHLRCSHFVTPMGFDAPHEYSCAEDVARLAAIVLRTPFLARIVRTRHIVLTGFRGNPTFNLVTTNLLLGAYPGAIGVKTGTTTATGASLVAAADRQGHTELAVVLGSTDLGRFHDAAKLLNYDYADYSWPASVDTMWSTASLMNRRPGNCPSKKPNNSACVPASTAATTPVRRWELGWLAVDSRGAEWVPSESAP